MVDAGSGFHPCGSPGPAFSGAAGTVPVPLSFYKDKNCTPVYKSAPLESGYHACMHTLQTYYDPLLQDAWGSLRPLLREPTIREIMVNRPDAIWVEQHGVMRPVPLQFSAQAAWNLIQILACVSDQNAGTPESGFLLDVALPQLRISAVRHPIAVCGHALCIRKHAGTSRTLADYITAEPIEPGASAPPQGPCKASQAFDQTDAMNSALDVLVPWVEQRRNILVSGATSSGKTSFLNALLALLPPEERLITIEDTCELQINHSNCVSFEANASCSI